IRDQEKAELSGAERLLEQLEQEISDLQRRITELEQLSHTHDHIHFLQEIKVLVSRHQSPKTDRPNVPADVCEDSLSINVNISFDAVRKSLSELKKRLEEFCQEELIKIREHDFCDLTLDPNTVYYYLILSEKNKVVTCSETKQPYSDHPERFNFYRQVLSKESVCGRCYWEVERSSDGYVLISVSYKDIRRKGGGDECWFGRNNQSWSLECSSSSVNFWHNNVKTDLKVPSSSRIGVYVDHSAGTLSFYSVSDTMKLLHSLHTTFTQTLYAGFCFLMCKPGSTKQARFFPDLHAEVSNFWETPYSVRTSFHHSSLYANVVGAKAYGYGAMPRVEEMLANYLSPSVASSLKAPVFPTKPLHATSALVGKVYAAAGQAAGCLHTMGVLQAYQADLLRDLDEGLSSGATDIVELRHAADLTLRATKHTARAVVRSMVALVATERHLWLTLSDLPDKDRAVLLNAPMAPPGLFGDAVTAFVNRFQKSKKQSAAFHQYLTRRSRGAGRRQPQPVLRGPEGLRSLASSKWAVVRRS
ncbi:hypothetical protein HF521_008317, partial [Silurus meridionalis]